MLFVKYIEALLLLGQDEEITKQLQHAWSTCATTKQCPGNPGMPHMMIEWMMIVRLISYMHHGWTNRGSLFTQFTHDESDVLDITHILGQDDEI